VAAEALAAVVGATEDAFVADGVGVESELLPLQAARSATSIVIRMIPDALRTEPEAVIDTMPLSLTAHCWT
jgi:hypothetical protein